MDTELVRSQDKTIDLNLPTCKWFATIFVDFSSKKNECEAF
jgi:hypothetical protein